MSIVIFIKGNVKGKFLGTREILIFFKVRNLWKTIERINVEGNLDGYRLIVTITIYGI